MKPTGFAYHAPEHLDDVTSLLAEHGESAKVLAGGQSLVPMMSLRLASFDHVIDLNRVGGLSAITRTATNVRVGAMVRQATAEHNADIAAVAPLLARALPHIGHFQIRNRGTVGGSIAHADPASELPAVALALGATLEATGANGIRRIEASEFFVSTWQTSLDQDEVLSAVEFPTWEGRCGFAVEEVARRHGDFALVGAAVGVSVDEGAVSRVAIALFGVGPTPLRAIDAEAALRSGASVTEVGHVASDRVEPSGDIHASAAYRKRVTAVVVKRALATAIEEASK